MKLGIHIIPLDSVPSLYSLTSCDRQYQHGRCANLWGGSETRITGYIHDSVSRNLLKTGHTTWLWG